MDSLQAFAAHYTPSQVELGFVINLQTLREVIKSLNVSGRRWWIACDPDDAIERGYVTVGHGDQHCVDRLNSLAFRVPVLSKEKPWGGNDRMLLLFDSSSIVPDQPGFYLEDGRIEQDELEDFLCFFRPVKAALIKRMQTGS